MRLRFILFFILLTACTPNYNYPTHDYGGYIMDYKKEIELANKKGEIIRINGECDSACVLKLSAKQVCISPDTKFGVHEVRLVPIGKNYADEIRNDYFTNFFRNLLPKCVHELFDSRNGFGSGELVFFYGYEILKACPNIFSC
jgi:hypothetical protein